MKGCVAIAIAVVAAALLLAACGGGGESTSAGGAKGGTVATVQLAEKIGLVSNGEGEYRLGGCTAKALLTSPGAIGKAEAAGQKVVTDPTGRYGIEIEHRAHCAEVMEGAVAILNVP
jgi:predicted small secreted protein